MSPRTKDLELRRDKTYDRKRLVDVEEMSDSALAKLAENFDPVFRKSDFAQVRSNVIGQINSGSLPSKEINRLRN